MERVKLLREESREFVGVGIVELDDENRRVIFHIDDEDERNRVAWVFKETVRSSGPGRDTARVSRRSTERIRLHVSGFISWSSTSSTRSDISPISKPGSNRGPGVTP